MYLNHADTSTQVGAVLTGALQGAGVLSVESPAPSQSPAASLLLTGSAANTNGGLTVGTQRFQPVDVYLDKPANVNAISHNLDLGAGDVLWLNDEQIDDSATVHVHWLGTLDMDGAVETVGDTTIDGVVSLSTLASLSAGHLSVGNLAATSGSVISMVVDDQASDQFDVRGTASIDGAVLDLQASTLTAGRFHTLLAVAGTQPVTGTFVGLPEAAQLQLGGATFEISYRAGDGNDIVIGPVGSTSPPIPVAHKPPFAAVSPVRVLETRVSEGLVGYVGARPVAGQVVELSLAGVHGVPADAAAVALNVTAVDAAGSGFVTVWPCGEPRPTASNLNFVAGQTVPNLVVTRLGSGGKVCLFTQVGVDLLADLQGWFPAGAFAAVSPVRVLETRVSEGLVGYVGARPVAGQVVELSLAGVHGVPADAAAVALNVTAVDAAGSGFVTVWPCGEPRPTASNLNFVAGQTVPNLVVTRLGSGGKVCLFTQVGVDLLADLQGWFPAGAFAAVSPVRVLETRVSEGLVGYVGARPVAGQVVELSLAGVHGVPADAAAVALNVTAVDAAGSGFVTVWPCGEPRPTASNLNFVAGQTVPNLVVTRLGSGGKVCLFTQVGVDLLADLQGWFPA